MSELNIGFWEVEDEMKEEELVSLRLAADKIATEIGKAIKALQGEKPDFGAAKTAVQAAAKSYEGYAYGYAAPDEPKLKGRFNAALEAIGAKGAKKAIATLEKIKGSQHAKPKEKPKEEREQQAEAEEEIVRIKLAGTIKKERGEFVMTLITPGKANGYEWPEDVLRRDLAVFDGMTSFVNHERRDVMAARPGGRVLEDICGVYFAPVWSDEVRGVQARWRAMPPKGAWMANMIDTIIDDRAEGLPVPDVGVSVDVSFAHRNDVVTRLATGHSGDIAFNVARGPKYGEAFARVANAVQEMMAGGVDVEEKEKQEQKKKEEEAQLKQQRAMLAAMAETVVDARVNGAELPVPAAARVREQFANVAIIDVEKLDEAIKVEQAYLATLIEDSVIKGMGAEGDDKDAVKRVRLGGSLLTVGPNPMEQVQLAVDRWFGVPIENPEKVPRIDMSQLYADLTGDVGMTGLVDIPGAIERTGLANITDTTFAGVVADSLNKVIVDQWQMLAAEGYDWYKKVVLEQDFPSLHEVEWVTFGGFGDLPELNAGQEYPELSISDLDTSEDTGDWVKPGGLISIPIETFDKGPMGAFKGLPKALAVAAIRNLSAKVSAVFTADSGQGPQLADGDALFDTNNNHKNYATTAFDFDAWQAVIQAQYKQTEQESNKRMAIRPWGVLVPIELEGKGIQVLSNDAEDSTTDRNINPYQYARERVVVVPDWTDATDWAAFCNPKVYPSIGIGYRYGRRPKVIAEPGGAGAYGMFTQDVRRWKVMWRYTVDVISHRGLQKRVVAG